MSSNRNAQPSDTSGVSVMKEIKDDDPSVLVIVVPANSDEEVAVEAFRNGVRDYLKKPFSISETSQRKSILPKPETQTGLRIPHSAVNISQFHKIEKAIRFINENYLTDIRLAAAAREAKMSPAHFSRIFKKVMGMSYQDYLNNRRIKRAENLLLTTAKSITEIAASLGFADSTGFGRIFKKVTGYTPSAYRNFPRK
jgi:two-component system response regulator YesN